MTVSINACVTIRSQNRRIEKNTGCQCVCEEDGWDLLPTEGLPGFVDGTICHPS